MRKLIYIPALLLLLSCAAGNCPLENAVTCNYGFYDKQGNACSIADTINVSAKTSLGDTLLANKLVDVSSMSLDMRYYGECDTLILSYLSLMLCDTIYIEHKGYTYVELPECGAHRFHTITAASSTNVLIQSIEIANDNVNYKGNENIKLYFNATIQ